jgi:hypothetical protein
MTKFAVGLGFFQFRRIVGPNPVHALIIDIDYFLMGKLFDGKGRLNMALGGTVYGFFDRVMRKFGDIGVAFGAGDNLVNAMIINILIDIIIELLAVFANSTEKAVFVAYKTGFFFTCLSLET